MDDLTAALATSFQVTTDPNNPAAPHPRFNQYKAKVQKNDQEERRRKMLDSQKQHRYDFMNLARRLAEDQWEDMEPDEEEEEDKEDKHEDMDCETVLRRPGRYFRNQLMLSEWMVEVPSDFATEWLMVPCPVGRRNLVVASKGRTNVYTKSGYKVKTFPSLLPGGNSSTSGFRKDYTVLDCIFNEVQRTFYILDLMCWKSHPVYDSDTEFRFYWIQAKMAEIPNLSTQSKLNPYKFVALPSAACTPESIRNVLESQMDADLDGLLYYHKKTHYTFGRTPLVTWLKAYMVPEILNIPVQDKYLAEKPSSYTDFATHAEQVHKEKQAWEEKNSPAKEDSGTETMEVSKGQGHKHKRGRRGKGKGSQTMDVAEASEGQFASVDATENPFSFIAKKN